MFRDAPGRAGRIATRLRSGMFALAALVAAAALTTVMRRLQREEPSRAVSSRMPIRSFLRWILVAPVAAIGVSAAANAAPLPFERIISVLDNVRTFEQVTLSPDGRRFAYAETTGTQTHILLADVAHPRAVHTVRACTGGGGCSESDFAWSNDSRRIAFVTTAANGQGQIAVADVATGAVVVVTHARGPLSTPRFSPDGARIAFLYSPGAPKTPSPLNASTPDAGVVGGKVYEQRLAVVPSSGGTPRLLGPANLNVYEYDWSPDGSRFAASAAIGNGDANWWVANLYTIDLASGAARTIHHPALQMASPRWSADGTKIAYIGGIMSDESITGGDVYVVNAGGGAATDITPNLRASVTTIAWDGSSRRVMATEFAAGDTVIASIDVKARTQRTLWSGEKMLYASGFSTGDPGDRGLSTSRDGRVTAAISQSLTTPPEIILGPIGSWSTVTSENASVPTLVGSAKNVTWTNDGQRVQGWLLLPRGYTPSRTYSLVTVVHGGPAYAHYNTFHTGPSANDTMLAARGYIVFEPNPRGSYGQGEAFTHANVKDFGYGDLRDVLAGLDTVERTVHVNPRHVGIYGWSYGGYMTMWAITQTHRFTAAVAGAGLSDWLSYYGTNDIDTWMIPYFGKSVYADPAVYARSSPITFITKVSTPTLMVHGDRDAEVPVTQSYEYWHALKDFGVPTQLVVYPGEGHEFAKPADQLDVKKRIAGWFDRWFGAAE